MSEPAIKNDLQVALADAFRRQTIQVGFILAVWVAFLIAAIGVIVFAH